MSTTQVVVFLFYNARFHVRFFYNTNGGIMQITLIKSNDATATLAYRIARTVYAQSGAKSLLGVQALTSMIKNISDKSGRQISDIVCDEKIFPVLSSAHPNHERLKDNADTRAMQMCVRVATRMLKGVLDDYCYGATIFHPSDTLPSWATCRGYIADIDDMLFYL